MNKQDLKTPEHQAIYERLREIILFGEVEPGEPLTIMGLTERIGAGMTPVREAIRRLTAEGALEILGNRRICVPPMTVKQLEEVRFARLAVEPELAFRAAMKADSRLLTDLRDIDRQIDAAIARGNIRTYLEQNYRFHFRLYAHSGADVLLNIAHSLWMRVGPSLRIVCGRYGTSNLPDHHDAAMGALEAGDSEAVSAAIEKDICQGLDQLRQSMAESATFSTGHDTD